MSLLDDASAAGPDIWWDTDDLARSGTYKAGGAGAGTAVAVLALYGRIPAAERTPVNPGLRSRYLIDELTVLLQVAEVALPREGDTLTLGGDIWTVREVEAGDHLAWRVRLIKNIRASQG